ncbi:MAG: AMP-binding protein, partial [Burkholderiales bacterium]|nr:AMP-binding protein [Burkholderiales bacterium]
MRTIRHYVDRRAAEQPDATWLIAPETGATMTYARLQRDSQDLTRFLLGKGLRKGDKVALMLHNGYQAARLLIGTMYGGFMVAPLNLLAQPSQLAYVLEHSDTRLVFTSGEFAERLKAALTGIRREIAVVAIDPDATEIFNRAALPDAPLPDVAETDDALLMYTSGTTGKPKGCVLSNRSVCAGGEYTSAAHELSARDRVLCAMPLYHINGQIVTAVAPLVHGGSVVMPRRFSVSNYWDLVAQYQCTWINVVPTIIAYLLNAPPPRERGLDVSRVKFC